MRFCKNYHRLPDTPTKRGCDECRRENLASIRLKKAPTGKKPLALVRPRKAKRKKNARLTNRQVHALHQMNWRYGISVMELARQGWERWGYASAKSAERCLRDAFRLEGLTPRPWHEIAPDRCAGCDSPMGERTKGCYPCSHRHRYRKLAGLPYVEAPSGCAACGCDRDGRTVGCSSCRTRHYYRRIRNAEAARLDERRAA